MIIRKTYVAVIHKGSYEDKETLIVYCGIFHEDAVKAIKDNSYSKNEDLAKVVEGKKVYPLNGDINSAWVETWEDGKKIEVDEIIS